MNELLVKTALPAGVVLALVVGLCLAYTAHAQNPRAAHADFRSMGHGYGPHRIFKQLHRLDLSREQREKIGALADAQRPLMRSFMLDMRDSKQALNEILASGTYDEATVQALARQQSESAEKAFLAMAASLRDISAILTPEQREELAKMMKKRKHRFGHRRHHDGKDEFDTSML